MTTGITAEDIEAAYNSMYPTGSEGESKTYSPEMSGQVSVEDAVKGGYLDPIEENKENTQTEENSQYEKLSVGETFKDIGKATWGEASRLWKNKKDEGDVYKAKTHVGNIVSDIYRWGAGMAGVEIALWALAPVTGGATGWAAAALGAARGASWASRTVKAAKAKKAVEAGFNFFRGTNLKNASALQKHLWSGFWSSNIATMGLIQGDEGKLVDLLPDNNLYNWLKTDPDDTVWDAKWKATVENAILSPVVGVPLGYAGDALFHNLGKFGRALGWVSSKDKKKAQEGLNTLNTLIDNQATLSRTEKIENALRECQRIAYEEDRPFMDVVKENIPENLDEESYLAMARLMDKGEQIHVYDDGTFDISITNWEDAHKISPERYSQQMKEKAERAVEKQKNEIRKQFDSQLSEIDKLPEAQQKVAKEQLKKQLEQAYGSISIPNEAIHHMNESVKHTWVNRGLIGTNETLTQKIANKIGRFYKDKWKLNNKIAVEFVDGLTDAKGKAVEGRTEMASFLGKTKKTTNQTSIDKQKLRIKELEDKITQVEGGNKEVSDPLDTLKEKLRIAKEDLKNLQTKAEKDYDIIIRIDKNARNPYATLRSEFEHARDMAKGEVPKKANIEGSGEHFSRYIGDNEAEVAPSYTYKKSQGRAKALGEAVEESNIENIATKEITKESEEVATKTAEETTTETAEQLKLDFRTTEEATDSILEGKTTLKTKEDVDTLVTSVIKMEKGIAGLTWDAFVQDTKNAIDTIDSVIKGNARAIRQAFTQGDISFLNMLAQKEMACIKIIDHISNKMFKDNTISDEIIGNAVDTIKYLSQYVDSIRSGAGKLLASQKGIKQELNSIGLLSIPDDVKEGTYKLATLVERQIKKLQSDIDNGGALYFTDGKFDFSKFIQQLFSEFAGQPDGEAFMQYILKDKKLTETLKKSIASVSDPNKLMTVTDIDKLLQKNLTDWERDRIFNALRYAHSASSKMSVIRNWQRAASGFFINNVLSPSSVAIGVISNNLKARQYMIEKMLGGLLEGAGSDAFREAKYAWAAYKGIVGAFKDYSKLCINAFKNGEGAFTNLKGIDESGALQEWVGSFKNAEDTMNTIMQMNGIWGRLMMFSDDVQCQQTYRTLLRAKAQVQAENYFKELGKANDVVGIEKYTQEIFNKGFNAEGKPTDFDLFTEVKKMSYQNPLDNKMWDYGNGVKREVPYQNSLIRNIGKAVQSLCDKHEPLRWFTLFTTTPTNVAQDVMESSLLYQIASPTFRARLTSPDASVRAVARGHFVMTNLTLGLCCFLGAAGLITGSAPSDKNERKALMATGWRPYSFHVGDRYIPYSNIFPPLAGYAAFGADINRAWHDLVTSDPELPPELQPKAAQKVRDFAFDVLGSHLKIIDDQMGYRTAPMLFLEALTNLIDGDDKGFIDIVNALSKQVVPQGATIRKAENLGEHEARTLQGLSLHELALKNYFPDLFKSHRPNYKRDVFGNKVSYFGYILGSAAKDNAKDNPEYEAVREAMAKGFNPKEISRQVTKTKLRLDDFRHKETGQTAYDAMQEVMSTIEINGMTLQEAVRELTSSEEYQSLVMGESQIGETYSATDGDDTKIIRLQLLWKEYADAAKDEIMYNSDFVDSKGRSIDEAKQELDEYKIQRQNSELMNIGNLY